MTPSQVITALNFLVDARRPPFIWGPPGAGKSEVMARVAQDLGIGFIDVRMALMDPTALAGFPYIDKKGQMSFARPSILPTTGRGIFFLDELSAAPMAVQVTGYQLVQDHGVGEHKLGDGWVVMAAGNRSSDRAHTHKMSSALANRFTHIDFEPDTDEWYIWATKNGVSDLVRGFARFCPDRLNNFDPKTNERAFGSSRSWMNVEKIIKCEMNKTVEFELIKGTVGEGNAAAFAGYAATYKDLPTAEEILLNPSKAPIPSSPGAQHAVVTMLDKKMNLSNFDRGVEYVNRLSAEFLVLFMKSTSQLNRELLNTRAFTDWATTQDVL